MFLFFCRFAKQSVGPPRVQSLYQRLQYMPQWRGAIALVIKRLILIHVTGLRHFQLQCMHALGRSTIVPGDVPTFEAPIMYRRESTRPGQYGKRGIGQRRGATCAIGGTLIQVRQTPRKKPRRLADDRMAVQQNAISMSGFDAFDFGGKLHMVRAPVLLHPLGNLGGIGRHARPVNGFIVKGAKRADFGIGGTGIKCQSGRIAIEIDDDA